MLKKREDVKIEETWDLSLIYKTVADYEVDLAKYDELSKEFKNRFEGKLKSAKDVDAALALYKDIIAAASQLGTYASLAVEANVFDKEANDRNSQNRIAMVDIHSRLSFLEAELLQLDESVLAEAMKNSENESFLKRILKKKAHTLSAEVESVLTTLNNTIEAPYTFYNDIKFRDIKFPKFEVEGEEFEMSYNSFEGHMEHESNTAVRRKAFEVFSDTLAKYQNSTASAYITQVQTEKTISELRGYDSVFDYLLDDQDVTREMYDRQIDIIMKELAVHMRKYAKLLQKTHNLDKMTYADLKIELDDSYSPDVTFEKAKEYVLEGLSILGDDYASILRNAFENRWIDYAENVGKRTGAFCASPYNTNSFILMSFNSKMDEVMTLAHELGHAGHFMTNKKHNNILDYRSSMYFIEAPSTSNEIIMENHLLKKAGDDERMKRWVLSQMISKTYYHNFVTHLLEAAYQREVYKLVDAKEPLDADVLNDIYRKVLEEFWGGEVEITDGAELTWMRQPHYYMGLYSYTYSAGLTIGTQMANKIISEGKPAAENWVRVLGLGGSMSPLELAKEAGVDVSTDKPLKDTINYIGSIIDQLVELS